MGRARISIDKVVAKEENNTLADITILKPPAQKASIDLRARFLEILNKMQSIILAHPNSNFTRNIISSVPTRQEQDMYLTCDVAASACTTSLNETQVHSFIFNIIYIYVSYSYIDENINLFYLASA